MDGALVVCREHKPPLHEEMVFILGRMGGKRNTMEALTIMIDHLGDVAKAIEFVEREGDEDLWTELVSRCVVNPKLVGDLLQNAGSHSVDTVNLVKQIPSGLLIPNLSKRIMKIFDDTKLQQRLREGCNAVLKADVVNLLNQLNGRLKQGVKVDYSARCEICRAPLHLHPGGEERVSAHVSVVIFRSGLCYHKRCPEEEVAKMKVRRDGKGFGSSGRQNNVGAVHYANHHRERKQKEMAR